MFTSCVYSFHNSYRYSIYLFKVALVSFVNHNKSGNKLKQAHLKVFSRFFNEMSVISVFADLGLSLERHVTQTSKQFFLVNS